MPRRLTKDDYDLQSISQGNVCWICKDQNVARYGQEPERLAEDHCHYSDADRGLLCQRCNRVLGMVWDKQHPHGDSAELLFRMIEYLRHFCGAKFGNPHNLETQADALVTQDGGSLPQDAFARGGE
jgi:hypothetical protein